jgi:hypothetical protein
VATPSVRSTRRCCQWGVRAAEPVKGLTRCGLLVRTELSTPRIYHSFVTVVMSTR